MLDSEKASLPESASTRCSTATSEVTCALQAIKRNLVGVTDGE
jgi:hypothetical protein